MSPLILASNSPQRKILLKNLGIKFSVIPSQAEELKAIKTTCADLVQDNAILKARDVAAQIKQGIVVGADTVVYLGKKRIVLKPRDVKEAKRVLKILFSRPHWVYTGVAVVDAASKKEMIAYEKTKIFMTPLSDKQIDRYYQRMSPLDKAGGFNIEGEGSVFIHRIEGCYTNVIGLPIAKLASMLKKFGVTLLTLFFCFQLTGCTSEYNLATKQEESLLYGTDKEIQIGEAVSRQIEHQYKLVTDVDVNERVERILKRLVAVSDRQDLVYFIKVLDEDIMNAVSLPGGYIYVFKKIVEKADNDDQLASVIAHEMGHITAKHSLKRLQNSYSALLLQLVSTQAGAQVAQGVNLALTTVFLEYSQQDEFQADKLGVKYMKLAGYKPQEMPNFFKKLLAEEDKEPRRQYSYWRTHPFITQRISAVNQEITGKLEFKDYLNLIDRPQ